MGAVAKVPAGSTPSLGALAFAGALTVEAAQAGNVPAAIADYEGWLAKTLAVREPAFDGEHSKRVRNALKLIGMKIDPKMDMEQCATWLTAMTVALSNLPPLVIVEAAGAAIHIPMRFLNEVDQHVRTEAEKIQGRHRVALIRLRQMQAEIERASQPKLEGPPTEPKEYTLDEWRKIRAYRDGLGARLLDLALSGGRISQEDFDTINREWNEEKKDD